MSKFKIVKRFSLEFVGEDWKEAYINFQSLTVADVRDKFPTLSNLNEKDKNDVIRGIDSVMIILQEKFVSGKGVGEDGALVELNKEDLELLPVELLSKALSFLSQGTMPNSPVL